MGLFDQVFGSAPGNQRGMSPITLGLLGLLAYRTYEGKGRLAELLGRSPGSPSNSSTAPDQNAGSSEGLGGLLQGGLGRLLSGGAGGSLVSGGIGELLRQFQQNGKGDVANSWISNGPNKPISPTELEQALGSETVQSLSQHTGASRDEILAELSKALPQVIDRLTPQGRVPSETEAAKMA